MNFSNYTGFYVRIFVDGNYRGTLYPWDDAYCYTGNGSTSLYAYTTFSDGSRLTWGPYSVNCQGSYTLELYK